MRIITLLTTTLLLFASLKAISQPLSGTYTIGGTTPDYTDFTSAVSALNTEGISGPVTFDVRDDTYTEQVVIEEIVGASAVNTITFQSESGDSSMVILEFNSGFSNNYVMRLDGTDYFTLTGITIRPMNTSYANGLLMQLGCNNINISNCRFLGDTNSGYLLSSENSTDEFITVQNNYFFQGNRGISFVGASADREDGNSITNNFFEDQTAQSVYITYQNAPQIDNNQFTSNIASSSGYAIYAVSCLDGISVTGNDIYRAGGSYGIYLENCDASMGLEGQVVNNFVSIGGTSTTYGVYTWYCDYLNIYHNNVLIRSTHPTSGRAFYLVNGSNLDFRSNIGSNSGGGYSIYTTTTTNLAISDNNCFYTTGPVLAYRSGAIADLAAWQAATGLDANSVSVDPLFVADNDLHVNHAFLDGTGATGTGVTVDFDGDLRSTPPDIGADEFTSMGENAGLLAINYPSAPFATGTYPISADFRNSGINTMTSLTIQWEVNGVAQPDVPWSGSLATGASSNITLGNITFSELVRYDIQAWVTMPNGNADIDPSDDTLHVMNIYTTIGGPYTIGGPSPDFPNFSEAADAMNFGGLHAPVSFSVRDGIYNEQFSLGEVFNNDITNTISFFSESNDSSLVILEFNSGFANNYLVELNGTDYVSFTDMTFRTLNNSYANGLVFSGGCQDVSVANCAFLGDVNSGNLVSSGNSTDHNTIITNSYFFQGARGIFLQGTSGAPEDGATIEDCVFENQTSQAIYITYQDAPAVNTNTITSAASSSSGYGIYAVACNNGAEFNYNYIYRNGGAYGIYLENCDSSPGSEGTVFNNFISVGGTSTSYGIYTWYCDYLNIYFNNILVRSTNVTSGRGFYIVNGSNIDLRNNVAANSGGGYAIYATTATGLAMSDHNDFYTSGGVLGYWNGATQNTLADWQAASGLDVNSVSANPLYAADNDLHVNQAQLNGTGVTIPLISDDYDGDSRGTPPDIGADEFTPTGDNAGLTSISYPAAPFNAGSYPIQADILNSGFSDLTSVTVQWQVNGAAQPDVNWTGTLTTGNTTTVALGNFTFNELIRHDIRAWVTAPNGNMDIDPSDDTTHVFNIYTTHGGTYTIGGMTPDFPDFSEASDAMNFGGLNAAISFDVRDGTYNEQFALGQVINNSAVNTISYQSESGDSAAVILEFNSPFSSNYLVSLDGTDYVSFHQLSFRTLNSSYANGIVFQNGSNNISITNCAFDGDVNSGYLITSGTSTDENTTIANNFFQESNRAIFLQGNSTDREDGLLIENNVIENPSNVSIYLTNQVAPVIRNNTLTALQASSSSYGMYFTSCMDGIEVTGNTVYRMSGNYGMYLENCDGSPGSEGLVANNFVSVGGTSTSYPLYTWYCDYLNIYHNSFLSRSPHLTNGRTLYLVNGSNINLVNNIAANSGGGFAIYTTTTVNLATSDYNDLFTTGPNLGYYNSNPQPALSDWQTASSFDANSISIDPLFVSDQDLHTNNINLAAGTPLASVPTDIDGDFRSPVTPYIGADESVTANPDAGLVSFDAPVIPFPSGANDIYVTVVNNFAVDLTSLTFSWEVNGVPEPDFNWSGSIASGGTSSVNIGSYIFDVGTPYDIQVIISSPNGMMDNIPQNDTLNVIDLYAALSGPYTIGAASPDFLTFNEARDALTFGGVVGPVTLNVLDGSYNEQISFGEIIGASATNTVTFQSNAADPALVDLNFSSPSSANFLVRLTGTDFIRFRDITFDALNTSYHRIFLLEGELTDLEITGNILQAAATNNPLLGGSTLNLTNILIAQNQLTNGSRGIDLSGSSSFPNNGVVLSENILTNQRDYAIYQNYTDGTQISGNTISATGDNGYIGIYLPNCDGQIGVTGNNIVASTANFGIYLNNSDATAGNNGLIANNFISLGGTGTTYGINSTNSDYQNYYHNSINITNASANGYAFYLNGGNVIDLVNNILSNTGAGYGAYIQTTTSLAVSDYNDFYTPSGTLGFWNGNRSSLASWQSASGKDANSLELDPLFTSATDLHSSQAGLDGAGTPLASVTTDIDGQPRDPATPDIGADEFSNLTDDLGVVAITAPVDGCNLTNTETVTIVIQNYGNLPQTGFNVTYEVDGMALTENVGALNIPAGNSAPFTFATGADLSLVGFHTVRAWTELAGDQNVANDSIAQQSVEHYPNPTASVTPSALTVCAGESVTLTASGGGTYNWSTGDTTPEITVIPATSTTYTVTVTNSQGCTDTDAAVITTAGSVPYFAYTGNPNFITSGVNPVVGSPYDQFYFEIDYFDDDGDLPAASYPRVQLDYNSNGSLTDGNDRTYFMTETDPTDTDPTDGKRYFFSVVGLPLSTNYTLSFIGQDATGCTGSFTSGNEPDVIDAADISIFANDITFSDPTPDTSQLITVYATVHNYSGFAVTNFAVRLINQFTLQTFPDIIVPSLGPNSSITVQWEITTPSVPSWNPMEVIIDATGVIVEPNELDNQAIRPFINGDYILPGGINVNSMVNPVNSVSGTSYITLSGNAEYFGTALPVDPDVSGATVSFEILQTGQTFSTYTNANGDFSRSFFPPLTPGTYDIEGEVTDYTLTGFFTEQFTILPGPCNPDLSCNVILDANYSGGKYILQLGDVVSGRVIITNNGCAPTLVSTLVNITSPVGTPVPGPFVVPPLTPGQSVTFEFIPNLAFNSLGTTFVRADVDNGNLVLESNESNNSCLKQVLVLGLPDITPDYSSKLPNQMYECTNSITFRFDNLGGLPTGPFDVEMDIMQGASLTTITRTIPNIDPLEQTYETINNPFPFGQGQYFFNIRADVPLPNGVVVEGNELNNIHTDSTFAIACQPDFTSYLCNPIEAAPVDPQVPGMITLTANIRNGGNAASTMPFDVNFIVSGTAIPTNTYTETYMNPVAIGEAFTVSTTIPTPAHGNNDIQIVIDPQNAIPELNENNNTFQDDLCWEFSLGSCGGGFWSYTYAAGTSTTFGVGVYNSGIYAASNVEVEFEIMGPGLPPGWLILGRGARNIPGPHCVCPFGLTLPTPFVWPQEGTYTVRMTADPDNVYTECDESNNVLIVNVTVANPQPDLRILSQYIAPSLLNPDVGEPVTINLTYENIGASNVGDVFDVQCLVDDVQLGDLLPGMGLLTNDFTTVQATTTWSSNLPGIHIMRGIVDVNGVIPETNELNNEASRAIIVGQSPNLYFSTNSVSNSNPLFGDFILIDAMVPNEGDLDCNADVLLSYVNNFGDTLLIDQNNISVAAGDSTSVQFSWQVSDPSTTLVLQIVNSDPTEFRYDDNILFIELGRLQLTTSSTPESCIGYADGQAVVTVAGGTPPYFYQWSEGTMSDTLNNVTAGSYMVTVTDVDGADAVAGVMVGVVPDIEDPLIIGIPADISIVASGGNCPVPVMWTEPTASDNCGVVSFTSTHSSGDAFPAGVTTVTYTAMDAAGNTLSLSFDVQIIGSPLAFAGADQVVSGTTATLNALPAAFGTGMWSVLTGTGVVTDPSDPASGVTNLSPGVNSFEWTITNGTCPSVSDTVDIISTIAAEFNLSVMLEGPYLGGGLMTTDLTLPLSQPYTDPPWGYMGGESVGAMPADITDWVMVTIRTDLDNSTVVDTVAALLRNDGQILNPGGGNISFDISGVMADSFYVAVYHRNHVGVMSSVRVGPNMSFVYNYDFTSSAANNYGGTSGVATLEPAVFGMIGGDLDHNGQIQNSDLNTVLLSLGLGGYLYGDFDMNGQIQNSDLQNFLIPNIGKGASFMY